MKIALIGYGKMGRIIETLAQEKGDEIVARIDENNSENLAEQLNGADAAIDFSNAEAVRRNVEACLAANVPLVEGTTGWNVEKDEIKNLIEFKNGAFVFGANFSVGVNLFYRIADFTSKLFAKFDDYEVFFEEQHHSKKLDAPSGTALKLKEIVEQNIKKDFSVSSTRAGRIPGTHRVGFDGAADQILLEHFARSREGFASGAIVAAHWIVGRKGFFEFTDVMDEIIKNEM
ncbi:MAG: 4-hydroxy-tetrahydrodipicolinate reductase [Pyrinomonadaceae bacterium]